ncbi:hypothetical protein [Leucobacter sp. M11]|uniref:hypothetical protein n=1 Tax=Leucobacter sp. M11 TaxID=2993565 RepID=UPI002D7E29D3|nr:hypothetical protein [Leucobacter sp. M11]MEB4614523.1 hypothetical protein [Leucobacter sp. M11]
MSASEPTPDVAAADVPAPEAVTPEVVVEGAEAVEAPAHEPVEVRTEEPVVVERSVRYGRILTVSIAIGIILGAVITTMFPIAQDANYTLGQAVGFFALIGGVIGLTLGAILCLVLSAAARRRRVSARAVHTDVQ